MLNMNIQVIMDGHGQQRYSGTLWHLNDAQMPSLSSECQSRQTHQKKENLFQSSVVQLLVSLCKLYS